MAKLKKMPPQLSPPHFKQQVRAVFLFVTLTSASWNLPLAHADDAYTFVIKKQEAKSQTRWNLMDWLTTRDTMRIQDLWLAMHSPSPYEFFLGGSYQINQATPGGSYVASDFSLGGFSSIVGLEAHYESGLSTRIHGIFDFRFMGYHDQSTNLTLQLGVAQTTIGADSYRNALAGIKLTFYLTRFFGIQGMVRHYFPATATIANTLYTGDRYQGGGFIDFKFIRIYGDYFTDSGSGPPTTGIQLGTKIYF